MAVGALTVSIRVKHLWLLKAINLPLMLLGLRPRVPKFCISTEIS